MVSSYIVRVVWYITGAIVCALCQVSCTNDIKTVNLVSKKQHFADYYAKDVVFLYTDSARGKIKVMSPEVKRFSTGVKPYSIFPRGIKVVYFSTFPDTLSHVSADWAIRWMGERLWEAKGNVVARNTRGEVLNTEYLVWDEKKAIIYSDRFVKITSGKDIIIGQGFTADQAFERWKITKVRGMISVSTPRDSVKSKK
jgi:LPS export ABC transporter protein LptC